MAGGAHSLAWHSCALTAHLHSFPRYTQSPNLKVGSYRNKVVLYRFNYSENHRVRPELEQYVARISR